VEIDEDEAEEVDMQNLLTPYSEDEVLSEKKRNCLRSEPNLVYGRFHQLVS
jgi:hypothetical protein